VWWTITVEWERQISKKALGLCLIDEKVGGLKFIPSRALPLSLPWPVVLIRADLLGSALEVTLLRVFLGRSLFRVFLLSLFQLAIVIYTADV
jgi:hypothetical protein